MSNQLQLKKYIIYRVISYIISYISHHTTTHHISHTTCHISHITYITYHIIYHITYIIINVICVFCWKSSAFLTLEQAVLPVPAGVSDLLRLGSSKFITSKSISYKFRSFNEVSAVFLLQVLTVYKIILIVQFESSVM